LKTETEARNKLEEKVTIISKIESQFLEIKENESRIRKDYEIWLEAHKKELENCKKDRLEKELLLKNLIEEGNEKEKQLQKVQVEK
jgi:hypothetical protein